MRTQSCFPGVYCVSTLVHPFYSLLFPSLPFPTLHCPALRFPSLPYPSRSPFSLPLPITTPLLLPLPTPFPFPFPSPSSSSLYLSYLPLPLSFRSLLVTFFSFQSIPLRFISIQFRENVDYVCTNRRQVHVFDSVCQGKRLGETEWEEYLLKTNGQSLDPCRLL